MSRAMTAQQVLAQIASWKVRYSERHPGWATHNRAGHGDWGNVSGLVLHHTGTEADDYSTLWSGRSDLPGPLCQWAVTPDGTVEMVGWGRCDHAGMGSARVLSHVRHHDYTGDLVPGPDDTDGNAHFYGQETMYSGGHVPTHAQYVNTLRMFAAVCSFHKWTAKCAIGHKEWTARKDDPGHIDMATFRSDLQKVIDGGPVNVDATAKF